MVKFKSKFKYYHFLIPSLSYHLPFRKKIHICRRLWAMDEGGTVHPFYGPKKYIARTPNITTSGGNMADGNLLGNHEGVVLMMMTTIRRILFADGPIHKGEDEDDDDEVEDDVGVGDDDDCYANSLCRWLSRCTKERREQALLVSPKV